MKIHYIYYWSDLFRDPEIERKQVPVRYDPFDAGTAFAFVKGQWIQCHSEYYAVFHGHSERELMLATQEVKKRHRQHGRQLSLSAKILGDFLQSAEAREVLLSQRLRDRQSGRNGTEVEYVTVHPSHAESQAHARPFLIAARSQADDLGPTEEHEAYGAF